MNEDKIIRCITSDGSVMASVAETSNIVYTASKVHLTSPAATAALGRLLTAASIMGAQLKQKDASITLRINGSRNSCFRQQGQRPRLCTKSRLFN